MESSKRLNKSYWNFRCQNFSKKRKFQIGSMEKVESFLGNLRCMGHDKIYWESICLLYTSPSPRDKRQSRMPSSA